MGAATAQRCATTNVFAIASGKSAKRAAISLAGLSQASGERPRAIGAFDIGAVGDAQHDVMRVVEVGFGETGRIGRDQRQVAGIGKFDQRGLGLALGVIAAARQLDIEAIGEQRFEPLDIMRRGGRLALGEQPRDRPFAARGQRDQPVGAPCERRERDMRLILHRPVEMRRRDQRAEIVVAGLVLRIERQPVDHRWLAVAIGRAVARRRASCR